MMPMLYNDENFHFLQALCVARRDRGYIGVIPRATRYGTARALGHFLLPGTELVPEVPQQDWKELIEFCRENQIFPEFHRQAAAELEEKPDQNGLNLCWAWSAEGALEESFLLQGRTIKRLAPVSLNWLTGWGNEGYYLDATVKAMVQRGMASTDFVPDQYDYRGNNFKRGWEADALEHRLAEAWDSDRDRGIISMIGQILAQLKTGTPGYDAWNRLSHAMNIVGAHWDETQNYGVVWHVLNSWADGVLHMAGASGVPDEHYGLRAPQIAA
jgi:hypothetical protein